MRKTKSCFQEDGISVPSFIIVVLALLIAFLTMYLVRPSLELSLAVFLPALAVFLALLIRKKRERKNRK